MPALFSMELTLPCQDSLRMAAIDRWARAEPSRREAFPHVGPPDEPDLRVEVLLDHETLQFQAVPIARVVELPPIAEVLSRESCRLGLGDVAVSMRRSLWKRNAASRP